MEGASDPSGPFRHQVITLAKLQARPTTIYVSSNAEESVIDALRAPLLAGLVDGGGEGSGEGGGGGSGASTRFDVRMEKSSRFMPKQVRLQWIDSSVMAWHGLHGGSFERIVPHQYQSAERCCTVSC